MFQKHSAISAATLAFGAFVAFASTAEAGGYAGNACVAKKQAALGKYASAVTKAWDKYPSDATARNEAIGKALTKLSSTWTKEEAKAETKGASCDESTDTAANAAVVVDAAISGLSADPALLDVGKYLGKAMKAHAKYIKDPVKDPGKAARNDAIADASTDYLSGASVLANTTANTLEDALVEATTTAPNYPTSFQTISPGATVQYGKETLNPTCIDGTPYMYFARKGTSNNVLMYYQGGGACWDSVSCFGVPGGTCSRTADASDNPELFSTGFGDWTNPANPFTDWNVVFVTYCTCDVHWGDKNTQYGVNVARHRGRVNAQVAEQFAREHFVDPDKVFVTGSSAGSYGAIMNSYWLMKEVWPNADYAVLGDAGVGVITQGFLDNYIDNWGVAENFPEDLPGVTLPVQNLSLVDLIDGLAEQYPNSRFANYDTSYDGGGGSQCQFFQVMRHPSPPASFISDWPEWWESACEWNACMREFKETNFTSADGKNKNYRYYTAAGSRHTVFGADKVYTETKNTKADGTPVTVVDWVNAMIDDTPDWVNVDCNNPGGDCTLSDTCQGGPQAGDTCTSNADCGPRTCEGGANVGNACTANGDCPGSFCPFCSLDPDTANAPFANNNTITCAPTTCPCGPANAKCVLGTNAGNTCTTDANCPGGTCVWVNCSTQ